MKTYHTPNSFYSIPDRFITPFRSANNNKMKQAITLLFLLFLVGANGQTVASGSSNLITTADLKYYPNALYVPNTVWYTTDTLHAGDNDCAHDWLSSDPYSYGGKFMSCAVNHAPGERCSWTIQTRKSICKKCLMHIAETDENPNSPKPIPKPEPVEAYETLLRKIKGKG
jgi:hypothetical protein